MKLVELNMELMLLEEQYKVAETQQQKILAFDYQTIKMFPFRIKEQNGNVRKMQKPSAGAEGFALFVDEM
jgi:hypothetical protein